MNSNLEELRRRQDILIKLLEKCLQEGDIRGYYDNILQCCCDIAETSLKPLSDEIKNKTVAIEKIKTEAALKNNIVMFSLACSVEATLSWIKSIIEEIKLNRALMLAYDIVFFSSIAIMFGKSTSEILDELWRRIQTIEQQKMQIEVKVPENIEKELKEWLKERESSKKIRSQYQV